MSKQIENCNCGGWGSFPNPTKPPCTVHNPFMNTGHKDECPGCTSCNDPYPYCNCPDCVGEPSEEIEDNKNKENE